MFRTIAKISKSIITVFSKEHKPPSLGRWNRGDKKFIDYYDNCFTVSNIKPSSEMTSIIENLDKPKIKTNSNKSMSLPH